MWHLIRIYIIRYLSSSILTHQQFDKELKFPNILDEYNFFFFHRKEMEKARKKNMKYDFSYYLMVCKTFLMKSAGAKKDMFFSNSEEELFQEVSNGTPGHVPLETEILIIT